MAKMLKKELKHYRQLLLNLKERISEDIKHISEDTLKKSQKEAAGDISSYSLHMADLATDAYDREFSLGLASCDRNVLLQIDDALTRIKEGSYGTCEGCKKAIAKVRLKALPFARLCLKCQSLQEIPH
jgi:RNA polymerase-binding protein DksA